MSLLDVLLANDPTGELHAIVEAQRADEAAGITWGVFDGDRLIGSHPAFYLAEFDRHDAADAADRPVSAFTIRPIAGEQPAVAA
ncbi:hypothetical protein ACFFX1_54625 [Dactylosporangium sucinum]|uniref:Uncharacterized protein n=1 Tax=Dactylosporangium sucinum TaxID=1424081 RepID=A0A917U470_9ACTN|nr:hypothetical protein [Dactylosporangium sucinum]GGM53867.1 hypothetical protein GCM10007977_064330 [Dactylosporangium sucinum]